MDYLIEPFHYEYMRNAMFVSALVGTVCALLSSYLVLKGWSLIGDALSHSVVPGVAVAYSIGLPLSVGAFFAGFLAAGSMAIINKLSHLKEDAIIGLVFTSFFALGLLIISLNPTSINIQSVIFGNVLMISSNELYQIVAISVVTLLTLSFIWKPLLLVFFDENQASATGLNVNGYKGIFFILLSASTVASLQAVGALLVIAMVIIPGATAYLLTDRFGYMLWYSAVIGFTSSLLGVYLSYFLDSSTGGLIVLNQVICFSLVFLFAPKYGLIKAKQYRIAPILQRQKGSYS
ncbi:metal ABC transporter permease [Vibrio sp. 99-8-1]|uniref:metal ABC transporter permease n=1 Tax=Vibrio sp. 99-8-1 TaxID=2607602 RepID=UPI001493854A|nr:metal ABC transporter permease [Vibrio sp. 99-8-1]NOI66818.1 metal ABC transporter permease [Vibrio sp. 99-8-1]